MKRIGYIGLGIMGRAMAANLIKAGYELTVWNRTAERVAPVTELGATPADSPAAVAEQVEAVCINVTDTADVEEVIFGRRGIVEGNAGDTADFTIIDHSTISPGATREFATRLADNGVDLLDAPVSGGDIGARAGTLSVMVGGEAAVFERCKGIFEAVGKSITHVGPVGSGQACKACNQVLCALNLVGVCEAMALAKAEGLDLQKMLAVTTAGAGGSWALANLGPQIAAGDMAPGFMVDLIVKDLNIVMDAAGSHGLPLPGHALTTQLFRAASNAGDGAAGTQALSRVFENLGGFRYTGDEE